MDASTSYIRFIKKYPLLCRFIILKYIFPVAHPNIKAFVTHGGLLSILESIYFGVPVVGFPVIGDQQMNMLRAENMGFGITLKLDNITQETLTETLNSILYDQKYV